MSKWCEVRSNYIDYDNICCIIAWITPDDSEEGIMIATINTDTGTVDYIDQDAMYDSLAQKTINEAIEKYWSNKYPWKKLMEIATAIVDREAETIENGGYEEALERLREVGISNSMALDLGFPPEC